VLSKTLDRNISKPKFSKDGKSIYFLVEESGTSILASVNTDRKNLERVIKGAISINDYDSHEGSFTVLMGKANRPDNLYTFQKNQLKELTRIYDDVLGSIKSPMIEQINYKSAYSTYNRVLQ
jgi:Tol biopolymer transport system component